MKIQPHQLVEGARVRLRINLMDGRSEGDTGVLKRWFDLWGVVFDRDRVTEEEPPIVMMGRDVDLGLGLVNLVDYCDLIEPIGDGETLMMTRGTIEVSVGDTVMRMVDGESVCIHDGRYYELFGDFPAGIRWLPEVQRDGLPFLMGDWYVRCVGRTYFRERAGWVVDRIKGAAF